MSIAETSPLFTYWQSSQDELENKKRISKANQNSPASALFVKEPYKWENLYQSILRELIKGDQGSMKGFRVLLDTVHEEERQRIFLQLKRKEILDTEILEYLKRSRPKELASKRNIFRFARIFLSIFLNPFLIDIKGKRSHSYEHSGYYIYKFRKAISSSIRRNVKD